MPDQPFDRTVIYHLEKPLSKDINTYQSQMDRAIRFFAKALFSTNVGSPVSGFIQGGLAAQENSPAAMSVILKAGLGFQNLTGDVPTDINSVEGLDDLESYKPLPLLADTVVKVAVAPSAPNSRIDIIEVRADRVITDSQSRKVFNNTTKVFIPTALDKTLGFTLTGQDGVTTPADSFAPISLKEGIAGTPGVVPPTSPGYIKIAEIFVDGGVTVINQAAITDTRPQLLAGTGSSQKDIFIPAAAGMAVFTAGSVAEFSGTAWRSVATNDFFVHIPLSGYLRPGDRILSVAIALRDGIGNTLQSVLIEQPLPGLTSSLISNSVSSDNSGTDQETVLTGISFNGATNILEDGKAYVVATSDLNAPVNQMVQGVHVSYDTPT